MQRDKDIRHTLHIIQKYSWPAVFAGLLGIFLFLFFNQAKTPNPDMNTGSNTAEPVVPKKDFRADSTIATKKLSDSV